MKHIIIPDNYLFQKPKFPYISMLIYMYILQNTIVKYYKNLLIPSSNSILYQMDYVKSRKSGKRYILQQKLSQGSYGTVFKSGQYAIKRISKCLIENKLKLKQTQSKQDMFKQIVLLGKVDHPNVVKMYEWFQNSSQFFVVMQYCQTDLQNYIKNTQYDFEQAKKIMKQIVQGYRAIISQGIIHRDLKPANILIDSKGIFKITDLGQARLVTNLDKYQNNFCNSIVGTNFYIAPQVYTSQKYTSKCDIFSLGVVFYNILMKQMPWPGQKQYIYFQQCKQSKQISFDSNKYEIPISVQTLINDMLKFDPEERINWQQLHQFFDLQYDQSPTKLKRILRNLNNIDVISNQLKTQKDFVVQKKVDHSSQKRIQKRRPISRNRKSRTKSTIEDKQNIIIESQKKIDNTYSVRQQKLRYLIIAQFLLLMSQDQAISLSRKPYSEMSEAEKKNFLYVLKNFKSQVIEMIKIIYKFRY